VKFKIQNIKKEHLKLSNKGLTLVELIIFIIVGGIFLPVSFIAFSSAMKNAAQPDNYVKAKFYAEQKIEELTSSTYSGIGVTGGAVIGTPPETGFQRSWNICYVLWSAPDQCAADQMTDSYYKKIVISVMPPGGPSYDVATIVTKRPKAP